MEQQQYSYRGSGGNNGHCDGNRVGHCNDKLYTRYGMRGNEHRYRKCNTGSYCGEQQYLCGCVRHTHRCNTGRHMEQYQHLGSSNGFGVGCHYRSSPGYNNHILYNGSRVRGWDGGNGEYNAYGYDRCAECLCGLYYKPRQHAGGRYMDQQQPCGSYCVRYGIGERLIGGNNHNQLRFPDGMQGDGDGNGEHTGVCNIGGYYYLRRVEQYTYRPGIGGWHVEQQ